MKQSLTNLLKDGPIYQDLHTHQLKVDHQEVDRAVHPHIPFQWQKSKPSYILDRAFSLSSRLRIFPAGVFGTLFMKVTFRNLLNGATC